MIRSFRTFILAAGFGERLRPITNHIPKPLLPVLGKPLLESIVENFIALTPSTIGTGSIGINMNHKKEMIEEWAAGSRFSDIITLFPEDRILGTGGALKNAEAFLSSCDFVTHNGDIISDIDIALLAEHHFNKNNLVTLTVHDHPQFNNVAVDDSGLLIGVGKTSCSGDTRYRCVAFTGIAIYSPAFLDFLPPGPSSVVDAWTKAAASGCRIGTYDVTGCLWHDIGIPAAYAAAVIGGLRRSGETAFFHPAIRGCDRAALDGIIVIEKDCDLGRESSLRNCIVLPGSRTGEGAINSNCIIGPDYAVPIDESLFETVTDKGMLVGTGGSDRKYYRVPLRAGTAILMECKQDDPDFSRHIEYTAFLTKYGIPVPELFRVEPESKSAHFEDLGDFSLYSWLKCPRNKADIESAYRRVLNILVRLHCEASDHVSECPALATRIFDYDYLRWETGYFVDRFVKGLRQISIADEDGLNDEFHRLAIKVDSFPKRIIHRDFQSQNIMMTKGAAPRVIDYQGARMAPPAYDVASVLFDPYAPMPQELRLRLLAYYSDKMTSAAGTWFALNEFAETLIYCRLQRHMQALGAYGFLSSVKGKSYFMKHVPEGIRLLKEDVELVREEFPVLHNLVAQL